MSDPATTIDSYLVEGRPDWDAIAFDVHCSRCDYNLRGLENPRCPECGLTFEWADVLRSQRHRVPWLFEHCWRERPVSTFFITCWRSLRPRRFWREVSIHDQVAVWPLLIQVIVCLVVCAVALPCIATLISFAALELEVFVNPNSAAFLRQQGYPSEASVLGQFGFFIHRSIGLHGIFRQPLATLTVSSATYLPLFFAVGIIAILRDTLARCKVRTVLIFRLFCYALPLYQLFAAIWVFGVFLMPLLISDPTLSLWIGFASMTPLLAFMAYLFGIGLSNHLHMTRAWVVAVTAGFVGCLAFMSFVSVISRFAR